jgi:hypothetical protein
MKAGEDFPPRQYYLLPYGFGLGINRHKHLA